MKQYFFGEPVDAVRKREFQASQEKHKQEHEEFCKQLNQEYQKEVERINAESRQRVVSEVVSDTIIYLPELEEEDIDKICNTLKTLKKTL